MSISPEKQIKETKSQSAKNQPSVLMTILSIALIIFLISGCATTKEKQLSVFIDAHVKEVKPLIKEVHLAYWQAANTGNSEDYDKVSKLEFEIRQIYSNPQEFALLSKIKNSREVTDRQLSRQLDVLYNA